MMFMESSAKDKKMTQNTEMVPQDDRRNLRDEYKGLSNERVFDALEPKRSSLEVAIENVEHDFNVGTIVRSANNFNVARVHIIGRHKYNRRGAMCTDKYLKIVYWPELQDFVEDQRARGREIVAIENNDSRVKPLSQKKFQENTTLLFGSEGNGLTEEALKAADDVREIESFGSTRSVNVGVAAGIAMYQWVVQNRIVEGGDLSSPRITSSKPVTAPSPYHKYGDAPGGAISRSSSRKDKQVSLSLDSSDWAVHCSAFPRTSSAMTASQMLVEDKHISSPLASSEELADNSISSEMTLPRTLGENKAGSPPSVSSKELKNDYGAMEEGDE